MSSEASHTTVPTASIDGCCRARVSITPSATGDTLAQDGPPVKVPGYGEHVSALVAPAAPSWDILVTDWSLDVTFPLVVVFAAAYVIGVRRLQARGRSWPATRTAAFLSGLVVVLVATDSGLAAYDRVLYSLHVVQHILLGMVAPLLLVLGAPITLALQAGSRASQRRILRVLPKTFCGGHTREPEVRIARATGFRVELASPQAVHLDGEVLSERVVAIDVAVAGARQAVVVKL